ncbi:hypothetical protein [Pseudomonas sp.]|uniref:hypothetical protein n=1 Tax=Pseudomonas sp. TaxID=306 RepID=UPI0040549DEE
MGAIWFHTCIGTLTTLLLLQVLRITQDIRFYAITELTDQRTDEITQILSGSLHISHCSSKEWLGLGVCFFIE